MGVRSFHKNYFECVTRFLTKITYLFPDIAESANIAESPQFRLIVLEKSIDDIRPAPVLRENVRSFANFDAQKIDT